MTLVTFVDGLQRRRMFLARGFYAGLVVVVFALAAAMRFSLPQQPFIDGDFWGYLHPAISKLNGGPFQHTYGRDFLYPGFLYLLLKGCGDFRAICVVQHLFGLGTGALMLLAYESVRRVLCPAVRGLSKFLLHLLGLLPAVAFLLAPSAVSYEQSMRPEGIFPFFAVLSILLNVEFVRCRWVERQPGAAAWLAAAGLVISVILYKLKPGFGLGAIFANAPLLVSLLTAGMSWRLKVLPAGGAVVFVALALLLPERELRKADPIASLVLPDLLYTIHADMIHDQLREDLAGTRPLPFPRARLEALYQRLDELIPLSRGPSRNVYPSLGFDPDYLLFTNCVFDPEISRHERPLRAAIGYTYYFRAATHHPLRMLGKIWRQLERFYRFESCPELRFTGGLTNYYHSEFARPLSTGYALSVAISQPAWLRATLGRYAPARAFLDESERLVATPVKIQPNTFAASLQFLLGALYFPGLLAVLATCGWTLSSRPRRVRWLLPSLLTLLIYSYNFGNNLTVAIVHSLDVGRYIENQFAYTLLASLAGLVFVGEVVRRPTLQALQATAGRVFSGYRLPGNGSGVPMLPRLLPLDQPPTLSLLLIRHGHADDRLRLEAQYRAAFPAARLLALDPAPAAVTAHANGEKPAESGPLAPSPNLVDLLSEMDSDLVLIVDCSREYAPETLRRLPQSYLQAPADLIVGAVPMVHGPGAPPVPLGALILEGILRWLFGWKPVDLFAGAHLLSRRIYENILPCSWTEVLPLELALHALDGGFSMRELPLSPPDGIAKLPGSAAPGHNQGDVWRVVRFALTRGFAFKPLKLFGVLAVGFLLLGGSVGYSPLHHLGERNHQVSRATRTVLAVGLLAAAFLSLQAGVILEFRLRRDREDRQLRIRRSYRGAAATGGVEGKPGAA